jgi:hypothetical protein
MVNAGIDILWAYWTSSSGRATLASAKRGHIHMDSADLVAYKADGQLVGSFLGIPIFRQAALANDTFAYHDEAGNTLLTNV